MELSLRLPIFAILCILFAVPSWADEHVGARVSVLASASAQFELGGSVERQALAQAPLETISPARTPLTLPLIPDVSTRREADVLGMTLFAGQGWDDGREAYLLGSAITTGAATTGISITYLDEANELSRSELFVDYAISENFSVGVAGFLDNDFTDQDASSPQLGLNAAYATEAGTFFEGGISSTDTSEPLFGVSIGLRF